MCYNTIGFWAKVVIIKSIPSQSIAALINKCTQQFGLLVLW